MDNLGWMKTVCAGLLVCTVLVMAGCANFTEVTSKVLTPMFAVTAATGYCVGTIPSGGIPARARLLVDKLMIGTVIAIGSASAGLHGARSVPVPPEWMLLASGLGLMGGVSLAVSLRRELLQWKEGLKGSDQAVDNH